MYIHKLCKFFQNSGYPAMSYLTYSSHYGSPFKTVTKERESKDECKQKKVFFFVLSIIYGRFSLKNFKY